MTAPLSERIVLFGDDDLRQGFDDRNPRFDAKHPDSKSASRIEVDPFPAYAHNRFHVQEVAEIVEKRFPVDHPPYWFLLPHEVVSRCNGHADKFHVYDDPTEKWDWRPLIVLSGKRIPLHPAMTRYLAAHEYGHVVDYHICKRKGVESFDKEYAEMRGIECCDDYGARKWHQNIGEIMVNDFRICVGGIEREFWPHPCPHPDERPNVHDYWYKLMLEFSAN